jgi:hypothetical protein
VPVHVVTGAAASFLSYWLLILDIVPSYPYTIVASLHGTVKTSPDSQRKSSARFFLPMSALQD